MPQNFTPKDIIEPGKEKEWASALGGLDWDKTAIVFTKRTFVEFLRYAGTTVDPNWGNVSKLPRYAQFGTLTNEDGSVVDFAAAAAPKETASSDFSSQGASDFKPSRRVTSPPGGKESISIFSEQGQEEYVPPPPRAPRKLAAMQETPWDEVTEQVAELKIQKQQPPEEEEQPAPPPQKAPEPDTSIWGSSSDQASSFRPTRRVREGPGGHDSLAGLI